MAQDDEGKEPIEEEIIKQLMDLRSYLEERIKQLEDEAEKLRTLFKIVDEVILTKSFKRAEAIPVTTPPKTPASAPKTPATTPTPKTAVAPQFKEEIPLKTASGMLLATIYVGDRDARIVPAEDLTFTTSTPPFQQFMITRILEPMRTKDTEDSQQGLVMPDQILSYEVITQDDTIKELIIKNYGDRKRLREIISSARWTFDKMYEKIRTSGTAATP